MIDKRSVKRQLIQAFGDKRYYSLRARYRMRQAQRQGQEFLFIHQMGKVGSTAVARSLQANGYDQHNKIIQTHFISPKGISFVEQLEIEGQGGWNNLTPRTKNFLMFSRAVGKMIQDGYLQDHKSNVITLVRDPIATNLSGFFHNYLWWPPELQTQAQEKDDDYLQALFQRFLQVYPHDVPRNWFDLEMKPVFGIDVFASEFPREKGYKIYQGEHANLLLLKLEKLSECVQDAFAEFLGIQNFNLIRANEAEDKWYADLYKEFKHEVSIPDTYADKLYGSGFMDHFYSAEEIKTLRQKWCRG